MAINAQEDNTPMIPMDILLGFEQFEKMGNIALLDIATHSDIQQFSRGYTIKSEEYSKNHLYLIEGEVELVAGDGKHLQSFKSGSDRAQQPLFRIVTPGLKAVVKNKTRILVVDSTVFKKYVLDEKINLDEYYGGGITFSDAFENANENMSSNLLTEISKTFKGEQIDLPSLPDVAMQVNKVIQSPDIDISSIADVVRVDPVISTRIVQVANSAMYAGSPETSSLRNAITRIGMKVTRSIVYSVILKGLYRPKTPVTQKLMERVYEECIRTGVVCHILSKTTGILDPDQALLAGIIHNIGVIPILIMADRHESLVSDAAMLESLISELEHNVGAALLCQWGFDDELTQVAREHDNWFREGNDEPDYCDIVQAAKLHCSFIGGKKIDAPPLHEVGAFKRLNLGQIDHKEGIQLLRDAQKDITETIQILLSA